MRVDQLIQRLGETNPLAEVRCTLIAYCGIEATTPAMIIVLEDGTVVIGPATHPDLVRKSAAPFEHVGGSNEDSSN